MKEFINVGLLGAGTVGGGVIKVLEKNAADIKKGGQAHSHYQDLRS